MVKKLVVNKIGLGLEKTPDYFNFKNKKDEIENLTTFLDNNEKKQPSPDPFCIYHNYFEFTFEFNVFISSNCIYTQAFLCFLFFHNFR